MGDLSLEHLQIKSDNTNLTCESNVSAEQDRLLSRQLFMPPIRMASNRAPNKPVNQSLNTPTKGDQRECSILVLGPYTRIEHSTLISYHATNF